MPHICSNRCAAVNPIFISIFISPGIFSHRDFSDLCINRDSAVGYEVMSEERTWSSKDTQPYSFKVFFRSQAIA